MVLCFEQFNSKIFLVKLCMVKFVKKAGIRQRLLNRTTYNDFRIINNCLRK